VNDPAAQRLLVAAACDAFTSTTLPRLAQLGLLVQGPA
jgi:hypothetical protein